MSCCKKSGCTSFTEQQLPASDFSARDTLAAARAVVTKLLDIAHLNNKILPSEISPLRLANLIDELLRGRENIKPDAQPVVGEFVLKFGPNKAYELHLPAGAAVAPESKDPQKMFDFDRL
jgi:hypothetical protein